MSENETLSWRELPRMQIARQLFGIASHGDKIYVLGGMDDEENCFSSMEVYDTTSQQWTLLSEDMKMKRGGCAAATIQDKIYVVGGKKDKNRILSSCEAYNVITKKWSVVPGLKMQRVECAAASIGNHLYVVGGRYSSNSAEVYSSEKKQWSWLPDMKYERRSCAVVGLGDYLYVFGGSSGLHTHSSCEVYDLNTQTWSDLPKMKEARAGCSATTVGTNIYVVGGSDHGVRKSSCEVFDTITRTWLPSTSPNMLQKRIHCSVISLLDSQQIYAIGGNNLEHGCLSSAEVLQLKTPSTISTKTHQPAAEQGRRKRNRSLITTVHVKQEPNEDFHDMLTVDEDLDDESFHQLPAFERVISLEQQLGLQLQNDIVFVERIQQLELHILGQKRNAAAGGTILNRIQVLEDAFYYE